MRSHQIKLERLLSNAGMNLLSVVLISLGVLAFYSEAKRPTHSHAIQANPTNSSFRNYDFEFIQLRMDHLHPDYFSADSFLKLSSPNEYTFKLNIIRDLPADVKSIYRTYEKSAKNKDYTGSITIMSSVCGDYEKDLKKVPFFKCHHFLEAGIKECPFKKGTYSSPKIRCTSADGSTVAPGVYWRVNNSWITKDNVLIANRLFELVILRRSNAKLPLK